MDAALCGGDDRAVTTTALPYHSSTKDSCKSVLRRADTTSGRRIPLPETSRDRCNRVRDLPSTLLHSAQRAGRWVQALPTGRPRQGVAASPSWLVIRIATSRAPRSERRRTLQRDGARPSRTVARDSAFSPVRHGAPPAQRTQRAHAYSPSRHLPYWKCATASPECMTGM
jgi:hypothetical protein